MHDRRLLEIKTIFQAALNQDPSDRADWLRRRCNGDLQLRNEVEELLRSSSETTQFLEPQKPALAALILEEAINTMDSGGHVGRYRLTEMIACGGMGRIYRAVRDDDQYQKEVAVKLIRVGMDCEDVLHRFRRERQTLANLDHPGIARLLDGGTTSGGIPYLVMEYVKGCRIDHYCNERQLTISDRLTLVREVCNAVEYAHRNLIVHRDLKPGNILVTDDGQPKLLDFGIAKLIGRDEQTSTAHATVTASRFMTPKYASPEQIRGRAITTASDVYSLGVITYELLTGHSPYSTDDEDRRALEESICQEDPEKPSTAVMRTRSTKSIEKPCPTVSPNLVSKSRRTSPEKLRNSLYGDIDTIVMKALQKDPQRRYQSVEQFSEDIRRHLIGLPISARPDTWTYRTSKLIKRNKTAAALLAIAILSLTVGGVLATAGLVQAQHARALADKRAEEAHKQAESLTLVIDFLTNVLGGANPDRLGYGATVVEAVDYAAGRIDKDLAGQPELQAQAHMTVAKTYTCLGMAPEAQLHISDAMNLTKELFGPSSLEYARMMRDGAACLHELWLLNDANYLFTESAAILRRNLGDDSHEVADLLGLHARTMQKLTQFSESLDASREAIAIYRTSGHDPQPFILRGYGNVLTLLGQYEEATQVLDEAYAVSQNTPRPNASETAEIAHAIARLRAQQAQYDEATEKYYQAMVVLVERLGPEHPRVAMLLMNLGETLHLQGAYEESRLVREHMIDIRRRIMPNRVTNISKNLRNFATLLVHMGDYSHARDVLEEAMALTKPELTTFAAWHTGQNCIAIAECIVAQTRYGSTIECEPKCIEGMRYFLNRLKDDGRCNLAMAQILLLQGNTDAAEAHGLEAYRLFSESSPTTAPHTAYALRLLGHVDLHRNQPQLAEQHLRESLDIMQTYRDQDVTIEIRPPLPERIRQTAIAQRELARSLIDLQQYAEAEELLLSSYNTQTELPVWIFHDIEDTAELLTTLYEVQGDTGQSDQWRSRSTDLAARNEQDIPDPNIQTAGG